MAQKFIINDNVLILGHVDLHEQLLRGSLERNKTVGGGYWYNDKQNNKFYFYGKSIDFGSVTEEQFEKAIKPPLVQASKIVFSLESDLMGVMSAESTKEERLLNKSNENDK